MNSLIGKWVLVAFFYHNQWQPPYNPELKIYYNFLSKTENEIYYFRENEEGFCRRRATYKIKNEQIIQKVTFTDPQNAFFCEQDPDMNLGSQSVVSFVKKKNILKLRMPLGEEEIYYVFSKQIKNTE